jgi:hypothetical protein
MSHGPMVSAAALLRMKRERDSLLWALAALLSLATPKAKQKPRAREMFDWRKLQAGEKD